MAGNNIILVFYPIICIMTVKKEINIYLNKRRTDIIYSLLALGLSITYWVLFKQFYSNPNLNFDSYYYTYAAAFDHDVSAWPIGYSKFIRFIGFFTRSANFLVAIQYFFLQSCLLYFFLSIRYFFYLKNYSEIILFIFLFLNPIYIFTSNLVLSDTIFLGLSLVWFVNLLWIIYRPSALLLFAQALLLFLTFTIRNSALFYPLIGLIVILISRSSIVLKIIGVTVPTLLIGCFILFSINRNHQIYGINQFSPFQGWKLASNALYAYEHVPSSKVITVPKRFIQLDGIVHQYFSSPHEHVMVQNEDPSSGSFYMFNYPSPLLIYRDRTLGSDGRFLMNFNTLSKLGPLYADYGSFIIRNYPITFVRYFVLPNATTYFSPYPEVYNDTTIFHPFYYDTLKNVAMNWYKGLDLKTSSKAIQYRTRLFTRYPLVNYYTHFIFIIVFVAFFVLKGPEKIGNTQKIFIYFIGIFWLINFLFMVVSTTSLLRYQLFITIIEFILLLICLEYIFNDNKNRYPLSQRLFKE